VQDGQLRHTLFLDEQARPLADVYIGLDDEDYLLMVNGMDAASLREWLHAHAPTGLQYEISDEMTGHRLLSINGPFAFDVAAFLLQPAAAGLPYLTFARLCSILCLRTGETGEYGYVLRIPEDRWPSMSDQLAQATVRFDMVECGRQTLDQCMLENWFFNIRKEGRFPLTPLELQLQWRVSCNKRFVGSEELERHRKDGFRRRVTTFLCTEAISPGDAVLDGMNIVGEVVNAGRSDTRGDWVGLALLDRAGAWPGLTRTVRTGDGREVRIRTVSPPVLTNLSLSTSPQIHMYRAKDNYTFPPLVKKDTDGTVI
jgi:glycine cleavage system aminomethyltransferase T